MRMFFNYMSVLLKFFFTFRFNHARILASNGISFVKKYIDLRWNPLFCGKCGSKLDVYFLRSSHTVLGYGDNERLFTWFKCSNDACNEASRLIEGETT